MKIIFMGTPEFAVPTLSQLIASSHEVVAVFTREPKPQKRGMKILPSVIHQIAQKNNITVFTPQSLQPISIIEDIKKLNADVIIVVAYGMILPQNILSSTRYGCINLHPSKLPRFRGAAPLERTILAGDKETWICTMQMDKGLDTGDILLYEKITIPSSMTVTELSHLSANIGAKLILQTINKIEDIKPIKQSHEGITYAKKLQKSEGRIEWSKKTSFEIDCMVRAMNPWPGVFFKYKNEMIKLIEMTYNNVAHQYPPGQILANFMIAAKKGFVQPLKLQRPSKKPISIQEFMNHK